MHAIEGPIANVSRFALLLDGKPLAWQRDAHNPFLIHAVIPTYGQTVEANFDYVPFGATISEGLQG